MDTLLRSAAFCAVWLVLLVVNFTVWFLIFKALGG